MIIIGEKINGAIPSIQEAIANRDEALIRERVQVQLPNAHLGVTDVAVVGRPGDGGKDGDHRHHHHQLDEREAPALAGGLGCRHGGQSGRAGVKE